MNEAIRITAPGVDVEAVMADIREEVERKRAAGAYADPRIARAERNNLIHLSDDDEFFAFYMSCLREAFVVDINDFTITERRPVFGRLLVKLKKTIWSLLKFYTYRLWSQQNQVNGLLVSAVENHERKTRERLKRIEERLAELEAARAEATGNAADEHPVG